ncbi:Putative inorganic phosphate cotransporter, partial [Araneus ventricosus]
NGILSAMPYAALAISMALASYIADRLRKCNKLSISTIRKGANSIGLIGPAVCCLGIVASSCQRELIVGLLCLAMFLNGFAFSGFNVTHVDMSADFSGVLFGITNSVANTAGILTPMIVGFLTASGVSTLSFFCV